MRASITRRLACRMVVIQALVLLIAPVSRAADLAALVERIPDRDRDGKHTGPAPEQTMEIYRELLKGGTRGAAANVKALVGMLVEPGKGEDYKARYVLHGFVVHVTSPGMEDERSAVGAALISSLEDARSAGVKTYVIGELHFLAERRAVRSLGKLLTDDALSDSAARALVNIGPEAAPELARAVRAARGRNRLSVVQALGRIGDSKSVDALVPLLRDPDDATRLAAAAALGKIADERAVEPLMRSLDATKGHETIAVAEACFVLASNLIKARKGDEALAIFRHMWKSLADREEPQIKHAVVEGLAAGLSSLPTADLVRRLRSGDSATRAAILHVLARRGDESAFRAVASAMKDKDEPVRLLAIKALGSVGKERSVPLLIDALPGGTPQVARALRNALVGVAGEKSNEVLAAGLARVRSGPDASAVRLTLLDILATRQAAEAADAVFALARKTTGDRDAAVRLAAIKALGKLADGSFAPRLVDLLGSEKQGEEFKAVEDALLETCRRIRDGRQQVEPLLPGMGAADARMRCALLRVAGRIATAEAVPMLVEALKDGSAEVRDVAMRSLSDFPNDRPAPELLKIARTTSELKYQILALRGYVRMAERKRNDGEKISMMKEAISLAKRPDERKLVLGKMGNIRTVESLKAIIPYISEAAIANEAGQAAYNVARRLGKRDAGVVSEAMEKVAAHAKGDRLRRDAKNLLAKVKPAR